MFRNIFSTLLFTLSLLLSATSAWPAELVRHTVESDGHDIAVWEKSPAVPRALMLLIHGRTWSTVPDFDLQVTGEDLSLMDGLVDLNIAAYGVDLRGYGETPRDASGWLTPNQSVRDVSGVLQWLRQRHPDPPEMAVDRPADRHAGAVVDERRGREPLRNRTSRSVTRYQRPPEYDSFIAVELAPKSSRLVPMWYLSRISMTPLHHNRMFFIGISGYWRLK